MDTNTQLKNFCRNLRILRQSLNLPTEVMAALLNISYSDLISIEAGTLPPEISAEIFILIYQYFGIRAEELLN